MTITTDLPRYLSYALDPKNLVLHTEYERNYGGVKDFVKNWKTRLDTDEKRREEAIRAVTGIQQRLNDDYSRQPYDKGLDKKQLDFINQFPSIIDEMIKLVREEDSLYRISDISTGRQLIQSTQVIPYLYDYFADGCYKVQNQYLKVDLIKLLRFFQEVVTTYFLGLPKPEKNLKELSLLELPTDTAELKRVVEEAFTKGEQGELFLWRQSKKFSDLLTWWFKEDFDVFLVKYLNQLDPDLDYKLAKEKKSQINFYGKVPTSSLRGTWDTAPRPEPEDEVEVPAARAAAPLPRGAVRPPLTREELEARMIAQQRERDQALERERAQRLQRVRENAEAVRFLNELEGGMDDVVEEFDEPNPNPIPVRAVPRMTTTWGTNTTTTAGAGGINWAALNTDLRRQRNTR